MFGVNRVLSPCRHGCGMAGWKLPKLRWLLAGALAAGIWVVRQDAERPRPPERVPPAKASIALPRTAEKPPSRPSKMTTSSIPRPDRAVSDTLQTVSRVRMRAKADTAAETVAMIEAGQTVRVLARTGKWRQVSVAGRTGWVHGDYLARQKPGQPRPRLSVPGTTPVKQTPRAPSTGKMRPVRAPQGGNCQCPYDLMIDGSECGEHSAYVMHGIPAGQCYL